ncbi:MAG: enoyl-CoA hydratase-related protein, partial [Woeseiaceae bacterium]
MNTLNIKTDRDGIAVITIDLKDRSMNVVSPEFIAEFDQAIDQIVNDESIKGAVVTSGKSSFVAGADLLQLVDEVDPEADPKVAFTKWSSLQQLYRKLETCGKPVVAAINGTALGGGLELCLACHYRVAADNPKAKLGQPEVQVGLLPGAGGTQRLPRMIGLEAALPLLLQGTHLSPEKATKLGIVDQLV